jgi:hypothetical protein
MNVWHIFGIAWAVGFIVCLLVDAAVTPRERTSDLALELCALAVWWPVTVPIRLARRLLSRLSAGVR